MTVLRGLRMFAAFWVDFIVGDDWTVAVTVIVALGGTWGLHNVHVVAWWLLPLAVVSITTTSVRRAVRRDAQQR